MKSAVVFDVGGVLLDWNPRYLYRKLLPTEASISAFFDEVGFAAWNAKQDSGRPWADGVRELATRFPHHSRLIEAANVRWPEMIAGPIHETVTLLENLKSNGTPVFAITNFSSEKWFMACEQFRFLTLFDDAVVSGDVGVMKPDAAIYHRLLQRNRLRPQGCIFVDDSPINVAGASAVGMIGIHFQSPSKLRAELGSHGVSI